MKRTATWLIMAVLFAGMAGCISTPDDETDAPYVLHIRTAFDGTAESDPGAQVPDGTPAASARLAIGPRQALDGEMDSPPANTWSYDPPCPYRQLDPGHAPGFYDCKGHPARKDLVLPAIGAEPEPRGGLAYPLPNEGMITIRSHEPFSAAFGLWDPYSDALMANRIQPEDECEPYVMLVWGEGYRNAKDIGAKAVGRSVIIDLADSGEITLLWMGLCSDDEGHSD